MSGSSTSSMAGDLPDIVQLQKDASVIRMVIWFLKSFFNELSQQNVDLLGWITKKFSK
jgi:hypothetical protein